MGSWLFGCDVCQTVCPWQSKSRPSNESWTSPKQLSNPVDLLELFTLDDMAFRARFRKTPLWRTRRTGLLRNAAIILGNQKYEPATETLSRASVTEAALVRGAAIWALGEIGTANAIRGVKDAANQEQDAEVREEIARILDSRA